MSSYGRMTWPTILPWCAAAAAAAAAKSLQSCPTQVYSPIKNLKKIKGLKKNQ